MLSGKVRVNWGQGVARLIESHRGFGTVFLPLLRERSEPILLIMNPSMDLPLERKKPLQFHGVELRHRNVAHFGPRFVLEGIVIEKLAPRRKAVVSIR